jgi:biotin carboxylase
LNNRDRIKVLLLATKAPNDRKTLCIVRSLAKAGMQVTVASNSFEGRPFHSRFTGKLIRIPHPSGNIGEFKTALQNILANDRFDVLLPTGEYTTIAMTQMQDEISDSIGVPVPGIESGAICKDKLVTMEFAAKLGLTVPDTHCPRDSEELERIAENMAYPCVIKPRKGAGGVGLKVVSSKQDLLAAYAAFPTRGDDAFDFRRPLIQEFIQGQIHEVCALFNQGQPRAILTQKPERNGNQPAAGAGVARAGPGRIFAR